MYHAQLTFGLSSKNKEVDVAQLFQTWVKSSCSMLQNFSLLPHKDGEKGQQITSPDQVPEDNASFYTDYFFNHQVLQHGNLTGMVAFQTSTPWSRIKAPSSKYFNWLRLNSVYLNQTKFKTATLVACSFLVGTHPGYLRHDEAERELRLSLGLSIPDQNTEEADIHFQLSSRTASVPVQDGGTERYSFRAVVNISSFHS